MASHVERQRVVSDQLKQHDNTRTLMSEEFRGALDGPLGTLSRQYGVRTDTLRGVMAKMDPASAEYQEILNSVSATREANNTYTEASEKYDGIRARMGSRGFDESRLAQAVRNPDSLTRHLLIQDIIGDSFSMKEKFGRMLTFWRVGDSKSMMAAKAEKEFKGRIEAKEKLAEAKNHTSTLLSYTLMQDPEVKASLHRRALGLKDEPQQTVATVSDSPREQIQGFSQMLDFGPLVQLLSMARGVNSQPERNSNNETLNLILQLLLAILQFRGQRALDSVRSERANDNNTVAPFGAGAGENVVPLRGQGANVPEQQRAA